MATRMSGFAVRLTLAPAVVLLLGWMLAPLAMTHCLSFRKFIPRICDLGWIGFDNYARFAMSGSFWPSAYAIILASIVALLPLHIVAENLDA